MAKPARKWMIGIAAMLIYLVIAGFTYAPQIGDAIAPGLVIGVAAGVISLLRPWLALGLFGTLTALSLLIGYNALQGPGFGSAMAGAVFYATGLVIGLATAVALLGGWVFDRFLLAAPSDPD